MEVPHVSRPNEDIFKDLIAEIISYDFYEDDMIQSNEYHLVMMHVQRKMKNLLDVNLLIDKSGLISARLRCEVLLGFLDLVLSASNKVTFLPKRVNEKD